MLFWERRPTYIQKYLKNAVRDLCVDLHKYQKQEKGKTCALANIHISEILKNIDDIKIIFKKNIV